MRLSAAPGFPVGLALLGCALVLCVAVRLLDADHWGVTLCVFKLVTGMPCLTCGTTRAMACFAHLDVEGALGMNPLVALLMLILAPIAAMMIQMAVSRSREYGADATGAHLVGYPNGLIGALRKLQSAQARIPLHGATPATAHLFIVNPFSGRSLMNLFSTHPPLEERIAKLQQMNA